MRRMRALSMAAALALVATGAQAQYAPQSAGTEPLSPELEARVQMLGKELRCAVCQGLSIADSPSSMARAQLDMVRTMVKEGRSDEEIRQFFIDRYGDWVLLKPSTSGTNILVWALPVVVVLGGFAFILWFSLRHARPSEATPAGATAPAGASGSGDAPAVSSDDPYLAALRSEIDR